jgi:hypothetical protein
MLKFLEEILNKRSAKAALNYSLGREFSNNPEITVDEALERTIQSSQTKYSPENLRDVSKRLGYPGGSKVGKCLPSLYLRDSFMSSPKLDDMLID